MQEVAVDLGQTMLNGIKAQKERRPPGEFFVDIFFCILQELRYVFSPVSVFGCFGMQ